MTLYIWPPVDIAVSVPGVATEATLSDIKTSVGSIDTAVGNIDTAIDSINTILDTRLSGSLVPKAFDAIVPTFGVTTDAYAYYTGGTGGTLLKTVTITYTDSTKSVIQSIISA